MEEGVRADRKERMALKSRWRFALILLLILLLAAQAGAASKRVLVLDFLALDDQGNYIDPRSVAQGDLLSLSRIMSQGIAARLVQFGEFQVQDSVSLREELDALGFASHASAWDRARAILLADLADQVITGSLTLLQSTAVVGVQRFELQGDQPVLVGSSLASASRIQDAPNLVDGLLNDLFPPDVQVIERAVEQVFVVPAQVRLNLGQSKELTVYALDALGRPVANPEFLFLSSDESKVSVDEKGVVTGLQPGTANVTVRAITKGTRSGSPTVAQVTVMPPTFGVRVGSLLTPRGEKRFPVRIGLRLTPTVDQKGAQSAAPDLAPEAIPSDSSNPLGLISSFFSSMLTNGLMTIDLDFDPSRELLVSFSGVQRSSGGYLGTGVGYVTPLDDMEAQKGFILRFTIGTQYRTSNRMAIPVEAVVDAVFPTTSAFSPSFRLGVNIGFDLFP